MHGHLQLAAAMLFAAPAAKSKEELRFLWSYEQGQDSSCGFSALATLLTAYRGRPVTESELVFLDSMRSLEEDPASGRPSDLPDDRDTPRRGTSLLGLTRTARSLGCQARAFMMDLDQLGSALERHAPALVHYDRPEGHYALALARRDGFVVVSDPALGTIALGEADFLSLWSGAVLLVGIADASSGEAAVFRARLEHAVLDTLARTSHPSVGDPQAKPGPWTR